MELIEAKGLGKEFGPSAQRVAALSDVDFTLAAGESVIITGESGSGKSTLLSLLAALDRPTSGEIRLRGERLDNCTAEELARIRRSSFGFVFQEFLLIRHLTALDNVRLPLAFCRPDSGPEEAELLLETVGMADRAHHRPDALSRGEMQRVALARALAGGPEVLFADEPTANLDRRNAEALWGLLGKLNETTELTVVVATHDADRARGSGRVVRLEGGRVVPDEAD